MFKKSIIIILIGICAIIVASAFCYTVFVKPKPVVPAQPVVNDNNQDNHNQDNQDYADDVDNDDIFEIDISEWETYRNEGYGFEIKYPSALYFFDCSENFYEPNPLYIHFTPYVEDNCNTPGKAMASVISISTIKDFDKNNIINLLDKNIKEKNIIIGNKSTVQISGDREVTGDEGEKISSAPIREMVYTIIPFENNISIEIAYSRIVSVSNNASGFYIGEDLSDAYNQILSTFKFIKPIDTSDWKTYTNKEFGFEIKYPEDWYTVTEKNEPRWHETVLGNVVISSSIEDPFYAPISITLRSNEERLSIKEWYQKNYPKEDISRLQKVKFNETEGMKSLSPWSDSIDGFYFSNENKIYSICALELQKDIENQRMMTEKLLSTLKFLNN